MADQDDYVETSAEAQERAAAARSTWVTPPAARELLSILGNGPASERRVCSAPLTHRCRCGVVVEERDGVCDTCVKVELDDMRARALNRARNSLPGMPWAHFGNPDIPVAKAILEAAKQWRVTDGLNLVLLGTTGVGKTTAAVALARHRLDNARTAEQLRIAAGIRFMAAPDLHRIRTEHRRKGFNGERRNDDPPMVSKAKTTTLLILDEVGFEPVEVAGEIGVVIDVMQSRYNAKPAPLPTIITSGMTQKELAMRYGEATKRRMAERARIAECFQ